MSGVVRSRGPSLSKALDEMKRLRKSGLSVIVTVSCQEVGRGLGNRECGIKLMHYSHTTQMHSADQINEWKHHCNAFFPLNSSECCRRHINLQNKSLQQGSIIVIFHCFPTKSPSDARGVVFTTPDKHTRTLQIPSDHTTKESRLLPSASAEQQRFHLLARKHQAPSSIGSRNRGRWVSQRGALLTTRPMRRGRRACAPRTAS